MHFPTSMNAESCGGGNHRIRMFKKLNDDHLAWHKSLLPTMVPTRIAIGSEADPTPFVTLFTGMLFANLAYWGTNQYVIQRSLAARSLAAGQKGVLIAGFFKLLIPFFIMLPGIIAFHLYSADSAKSSRAASQFESSP